MLAKLVDTALDRTVIGGYSRVGYELRKRSWHELPPMGGKVVAVTGATSGLGLAAAAGFARLGASVWLIVRNDERGRAAAEEIAHRTGGAQVQIARCDLSSMTSVREFAGYFPARAGRLDVLVNNAGAMTQERQLSVDGYELTLATNVLGPFLMTNLLVGLLEQSAPARVIWVSSGGMYTQRIDVDDLQSELIEFDGPTVYARTKRAEVILAEMFAGRLERSGVVVHSMHPGWADTPGVRTSLPRFYALTKPLLRSPEQGADTIVWLGAGEQAGQCTGQFWHDRRPRPTHVLSRTRETPVERRQLWARCAELTGWQDHDPHDQE